MTRPGACDNYSRGSLVLASIEGLFAPHSYHICARPCVTSITVARAGYPASVDVARRNVWHSLSQYVTQHPAPFHRRIGLLRVSSPVVVYGSHGLWCTQSVWPTTWAVRRQPTGCHVITKREIIQQLLAVGVSWRGCTRGVRVFRENIPSHWYEVVLPWWNT